MQYWEQYCEQLQTGSGEANQALFFIACSSVVLYYELMKTGWGAENEAKKNYCGPEN